MAPRSPLLSPYEYFERTHHDRLLAGLVVFVAFIVAQIAMFVALFNAIIDQVENAPSEFDRAIDQFMSDVLGLVIVFAIVFSIVGLLVVAAIMHFMSSDYDNSGTFRDAVAVAGWAYAPNLLLLPLSYVYARSRIEQQTFDGSDPEVLQREFEAAQADMGGVIPLVLLGITIVWSVYILAYGTAATHDVEVSDTLLPAVIVGIGAFIFGVL